MGRRRRLPPYQAHSLLFTTPSPPQNEALLGTQWNSYNAGAPWYLEEVVLISRDEIMSVEPSVLIIGPGCEVS